MLITTKIFVFVVVFFKSKKQKETFAGLELQMNEKNLLPLSLI